MSFGLNITYGRIWYILSYLVDILSVPLLGLCLEVKRKQMSKGSNGIVLISHEDAERKRAEAMSRLLVHEEKGRGLSVFCVYH